MEKANSYVNELTNKSVWIFTKQETDFDEAFKAAILFSEIPDIGNVNIESYFDENHLRYGITTHRHRILVMSQLFGLITKTPFFGRGGSYSEERPTAVLRALQNCTIGDETYNTIKTEQLLKVKIHAIIDTADNNNGYNVLPVVFIYKVLKKLQQEHNIHSISIDLLYTYIMTCSNYDQIDAAVEYIAEDPSISPYVNSYKTDSRLLTCINKNTNLFNIEPDSISINKDYDSYFYDSFVRKNDFEELHDQLLRDVDYSYFLYNIQGFNINLLDPITRNYNAASYNETIIPIEGDIYDEESEYIEKVDSLNEENININAGDNAYSVEPVATKKTESGRKYKINPLLGKISIKKAEYLCENNKLHTTFMSKRTEKQYMEAHHLIPVCNQKEIWDKFNVNIDCLENIVSICPTCHRAFHYGTTAVKTEILQSLYNKRKASYDTIGLMINLNELEGFYRI